MSPNKIKVDQLKSLNLIKLILISMENSIVLYECLNYLCLDGVLRFKSPSSDDTFASRSTTTTSDELSASDSVSTERRLSLDLRFFKTSLASIIKNAIGFRMHSEIGAMM